MSNTVQKMKEGIPTAAVRIRARVHKGNLEPLDKVHLPEGEEVTVTLDLPESPVAKRGTTVRVLKGAVLHAPFPLTRRDIYDFL